ncbi:MAG: bifunctional DNA-binding transcriptional regulator/O6-methylguanine-DNA methyltransferase Ada [Myxococcota bacterium]
MHSQTLARTHDDDRWTAVRERDRRFEGAFVYAVRTTGVFCRVGCASRMPLRKNVEFFDGPTEALDAGYRPCKKCRPTEETPRSKMLRRACTLLLEEPRPKTRDIAGTLEVSESYLHRAFKAELGVTPQQYRRQVLRERGRTELATADSVTEAVYRAGYTSSSRFYEDLGPTLGMPADTARRGGQGETIHYSVLRSSLGQMLIAWTAEGVCEVSLGADSKALLKRLEKRLPQAALVETPSNEWARTLIAALDGSAPDNALSDIPLDIRGTAFQARVWTALRSIPAGETRSYSELAATIGAPNAVRAVASACAQNSLAILVPCHRIVRKDGSLSGYRWGVERKKALLEREQKPFG